MTPQERLEQAWIRAGYPREYMPRHQFLKVSESVLGAFEAGEADFLQVGWQRAGVDFPFAPGHPRYEAMKEAYRTLGSV